MPPTNQAAYLISKSNQPLEVRGAPYTPPGASEIVVKNAAVAVNPFEWVKQLAGNIMFSWMKYPFVMGSDLAGIVVEVGPGVTRFKVGDRVIGHAIGMDPKVNKNSEGSFQEYTVIRTNLASPIPDSMSFEEACVLPLALSTAACGLFMKDFLALPHPSVSPKKTGRTLLVWGGSTSVGSNAIQLAVASGHEVITTASPKNFDYVKKLGAVEAFDYHSPTVVKDIIKAFQNREAAGGIAIGNDSMKACIEILGAVKGKRFIAQASANVPSSWPSSTLGFVSMGLRMVGTTASLALKSKTKGVSFKFIFGSDLAHNEVGAAIYENFLPAALAQGKFIPAPEPQVIGKGPQLIQEALDINKKGVSAKKVVVTL